MLYFMDQVPVKYHLFTKELYIFDGKSKTSVIIVLPGEQITA